MYKPYITPNKAIYIFPLDGSKYTLSDAHLQRWLVAVEASAAHLSSSGRIKTVLRTLSGDAFISKLRFIVHNRDTADPYEQQIRIPALWWLMCCICFAQFLSKHLSHSNSKVVFALCILYPNGLNINYYQAGEHL